MSIKEFEELRGDMNLALATVRQALATMDGNLAKQNEVVERLQAQNEDVITRQEQMMEAWARDSDESRRLRERCVQIALSGHPANKPIDFNAILSIAEMIFTHITIGKPAPQK